MGGVSLRESWCFCKGVSKSEKMKAAIFTGKGQGMATITGISPNGVSGTGFLIHRNLLLTTHTNLPSVVAADSAEIRLHNGVAATLVPQRFFITSSVLDLTIVGLDDADGDSNAQGQYPHYLKTSCKANLDLGSVVYLLGYTEKQDLTVGEGKVVIATDNLIKLSTDGIQWSPGSAGFDVHGNLAFMICDPMKLATSPNTKSPSTSSSSSSSWKKEHPMQFGIPIPVICDWLNQHWEGNLDELNKPKLPLMRLMSTGPKSEHSCASFTLRQVFKSAEGDDDGTTSSSNNASKARDQGPSSSAVTNTVEEESAITNPNAAHVQGIPTPEIYESPRVTAVPLRRKENIPLQLLDINFPPRTTKAAVLAHSSKPKSAENHAKDPLPEDQSEGEQNKHTRPTTPIPDVSSTGSVNGAAQSEVQSSSSPVEVPEMQNGYSSEGETMYSAETAESRNYTSPRELKFQQVGRSQSCVSYNRWGAAPRSQVARGMMVENQRSFMHVKRMYSQGAATSQRSNDYFSPTVSSIMKRNSSSSKPPRQTPVHSPSPRWLF
ncbi:uncharacterized protein LOC114186174 [Vigna unguiculata]|uniref:Peptidase S1 n=1 Tax=Vigna unguiculata TaxID=3917 RepID=A0A4D6NH24_VIGUN|nr:uncharacterized protein LOC114186174 [Vigna unguiculata]QCE11485.1 Peptidase S1 [Vigna unguiculata]